MINATPALKAYSFFRKKVFAKDPVIIQQEQLLKRVQYASQTKFGRDHSFSKIHTVADFQNAVPLRRYEDFWKEYWEPNFPTLRDCTWPGLIPYFPVSSGTSSGVTKYIPYTKEMMRSNTKAGLDILVHHVLNKPNSKLLGGLNFMLGGSTDFKVEAPGVVSGDLSGISVKELPWWLRSRYFPPLALAKISNWEEKIERFAEESLKSDIRMLGGVPSWMLIFIDKLAEKMPDKPRKLSSYYPNLELLIHGGVNFSPYLDQFKELLSDSDTDLREVYPASEGFIAIGDRGYGEGLRLCIDNEIFYEFVPVEELDSTTPTRHWLGNVKKDVNYAIVLSTCAGLWGYVLGDTVRFIETTPPRILITGRTSYSLSAFGEHLIAEEVEDAVSGALKALDIRSNDYCVGAIYPKEKGELGKHLYIIETEQEITKKETLLKIAQHIDQTLCKRNEDYESHRSDGYGMELPEVRLVQKGFFAAWMKSRGKLGGQNKVPRLINKPELFESVVSFSLSFK